MVLVDIQKILEKEEFTCTLALGADQVPFDRLLVVLGWDRKKRERILEIIAAQPHVFPEFILPKAASLPYRLQFRISLPFQVHDHALNQVASLLLFLNQLMDMPGFELNELEGQVSYRYVWIIPPTSIDQALIMNIMGALLLNLELFSETIENLAEGKMTFNELLSQITKIAH